MEQLTLRQLFKNHHLSLPNRKNEDWLYYNFDNDIKFNINSNKSSHHPSLQLNNEYFIYFLNGELINKNLPDSINITKSTISPTKKSNSFIHLAIAESINHSLTIKDKDHLSISLIYDTNSETDQVSNHSLVLELINSKNITLKRTFINTQKNILNSYTKIKLNDNCSLTISDNNINNAGRTLDFIDTTVANNCQFHGLNQSYLSNNSRFQNRVFMQGSDSIAKLHGISINNVNQNCFYNTHILHEVENCESFQTFKSIIKEDATFEYNGKVSVLPNAQKTNSYQLNQNIMIDDTANIYSRPQLFIDADDVKCSHGSTTGDIDQEELFYLKSRGIDDKTSKKIVLKGFTDDIFTPKEFKQHEIDIINILNKVL